MKKGRKILVLTFGDVLYDQRLIKTWKSLEQSGYEVSVFARKIFDERIDDLLHTVRCHPLFKKGMMAYVEYNVRAFFTLLFGRWRTVVSFDLDTLPAAVFVSYFKKIFIIHDAHEYFVESPELVDRPKIRKIWEKIASFCIPKVDRAYTVGTSIAQAMQREYGIPFEVIRNVPLISGTVDVASEEMENFVPRPYIIYQGALNTGRGLEQLIEVMVSFPGLNLALAGKGDIEPELKEKASMLNLKNIHFVGNLRPPQLKAFTRNAVFGLNLLENKGKSYYLSLANKFFDYIEAGIPQICVDFPEYRKLNDAYDIALLTESCVQELLREKFAMLLNDAVLYNRLKTNTSSAINELNWAQESRKLIELYDSWLQ